MYFCVHKHTHACMCKYRILHKKLCVWFHFALQSWIIIIIIFYFLSQATVIVLDIALNIDN